MKNKVLLLLVCVYGLILFGCRPSGESNTAPPQVTNANKQEAPVAPAAVAGLPQTGFKVEWVSNKVPSEMAAGKEQTVSVMLKNASDATWSSKGKDGSYAGQVSVAYHWLDAKSDKAVLFEGARTAFPHDLAPGETITLDNVTVIPPAQAGSYRLQLTLVQDGVAWFEQKGASTVTVPVTVH